MTASQVNFEYSIGDRVRLSAIDMPGIVDAMCVDIKGQQYRVVYWNDGRRYQEWVYPSEIKEL